MSHTTWRKLNGYRTENSFISDSIEQFQGPGERPVLQIFQEYRR